MSKQLRHKSWNPKLKRFQGLHSLNAEQNYLWNLGSTLKISKTLFYNLITDLQLPQIQTLQCRPWKISETPHPEHRPVVSSLWTDLKIFREHNHTPLSISDAKHGICTLGEIRDPMRWTRTSKHLRQETWNKDLQRIHGPHFLNIDAQYLRSRCGTQI